MTKILPILFVFLAPVACHATDDVYAELKDQDYWGVTLIVPPDRFALPQMEKTAREFLRQATSRKVVVLSVFSARDIAARERGSLCHSFKQWRVNYDSFPSGPLIAANMIAIGGNAVLRMRSADGTVTRRVLSGKDPTQFSIEGTAFEILIVAGRTMTRFGRCPVPGAVEPGVFVQTRADLNSDLCSRATDWIARIFRTEHLSTYFRNDHWFPCSGYFPERYPFSALGPPPSEAEYHRSVSFTCGIDCGDKPHCTQTMGPPVAPGRVP